MTREEAIARIENHKILHKMNEPRAIYISEALDMAIKALEQEPIIDKIRAKIEQSRYGLVNDGLDLALNIIDECVAESEE
jgi:hypothetical protein